MADQIATLKENEQKDSDPLSDIQLRSMLKTYREALEKLNQLNAKIREINKNLKGMQQTAMDLIDKSLSDDSIKLNQEKTDKTQVLQDIEKMIRLREEISVLLGDLEEHQEPVEAPKEIPDDPVAILQLADQYQEMEKKINQQIQKIEERLKNLENRKQLSEKKDEILGDESFFDEQDKTRKVVAQVEQEKKVSYEDRNNDGVSPNPGDQGNPTSDGNPQGGKTGEDEPAYNGGALDDNPETDGDHWGNEQPPNDSSSDNNPNVPNTEPKIVTTIVDKILFKSDFNPSTMDGDVMKLLSGTSVDEQIMILQKIKARLKEKAKNLSDDQKQLKDKAQKYLED
jgi:hypothetical protein